MQAFFNAFSKKIKKNLKYFSRGKIAEKFSQKIHFFPFKEAKIRLYITKCGATVDKARSPCYNKKK